MNGYNLENYLIWKKDNYNQVKWNKMKMVKEHL